MKVKQTVTAKFNTAYTGWNTLEFTDEQGDEIHIRMTDDNYLDLETHTPRVKRIVSAKNVPTKRQNNNAH